MTENEITKNNLVDIDNELKNLLDAHENIVSMIKANFTINNQMIVRDSFERIKSDVSSIDTEIITNLIPTINDRLS